MTKKKSITVNIENLVGHLEVNTNDVDIAEEIRVKVTKTLLSVINDVSSIVNETQTDNGSSLSHKRATEPQPKTPIQISVQVNSGQTIQVHLQKPFASQNNQHNYENCDVPNIQIHLNTNSEQGHTHCIRNRATHPCQQLSKQIHCKSCERCQSDFLNYHEPKNGWDNFLRGL